MRLSAIRIKRFLYKSMDKKEKKEQKTGFPPVFDENSKVLILGSFPSVKSREISFYYGNKQNRFWKMLCGYFGQDVPQSNEEKIRFLQDKGVALWDMVTVCYIDGSADASLRCLETANLEEVFAKCKIKKVLLNGSLAYQLFTEKYANIDIPYEKMPSTSPANPRYDEEVWRRALDDVFATIK